MPPAGTAVSGLRSRFRSWQFRADLEPGKSPDNDVFAKFANPIADEIPDRHLAILDEWLILEKRRAFKSTFGSPV